MKIEREPGIRCRRFPVRPGQWGKNTISESCGRINACKEWETWFRRVWKDVCGLFGGKR